MCAVEWKKLGDVVTIQRGDRVTKKDLLPRGEYPVISGGIQPLGYIDKFNRPKNTITIAQYGTAGYVNWQNVDFWANDVCYSIFPKEAEKRYLYYTLQNMQDYIYSLRIDAIPAHLPLDRLKNIIIPIPSLAKQQEIVSHLDTFTTFISNLESELDMRRKQYEHYRNQLLNFEGVEGVEWKTLGDLSLKITDGAHTSPKSTNEGYYMPSVKDMTDYGFDFSDCKIISKEDYEDLKRIGCQPNVSDILIAKDGSMLKYVFALKEKLDIVLLSSIAIITPKQELIMSEYLVHYLKQSSVREIVIRDYSSKGGVPRIILKNFKKIFIPTPAKNIQQQIVEKLDAFEQLIQSLETEIKLRKQQYEYYREKLLTFEK